MSWLYWLRLRPDKGSDRAAPPSAGSSGHHRPLGHQDGPWLEPGQQQHSASAAVLAAAKRQRCCPGGPVYSSRAPTLLSSPQPGGVLSLPAPGGVLSLPWQLAGGGALRVNGASLGSGRASRSTCSA